MKSCIWSIAYYDAEAWTVSESRSEIAGKLWNMVVEKDAEDHLSRSCEKIKTCYVESRRKKTFYIT
jgi:hypothetical protein